jgi:hypothetical protein
VLSTKYASGDLDVLSSPAVLAYLKSLEPDWRVDSIPFWAFGDGRDAIASSLAPDNRRLLVEFIKNVHGLNSRDFEAVEELSYGGTTYRVLDPISLLKAKAANVRDLDQAGPPERHDRAHLQLVARCWPLYLLRLHEMALARPEANDAVSHVFSRAFEVLQHRQTASTLATVGINRAALMPPSLGESPIDKIRRAYQWQLPRLR